jgi:hypothetical protein
MSDSRTLGRARALPQTQRHAPWGAGRCLLTVVRIVILRCWGICALSRAGARGLFAKNCTAHFGCRRSPKSVCTVQVAPSLRALARKAVALLFLRGSKTERLQDISVRDIATCVGLKQGEGKSKNRCNSNNKTRSGLLGDRLAFSQACCLWFSSAVEVARRAKRGNRENATKRAALLRPALDNSNC